MNNRPSVEHDVDVDIAVIGAGVCGLAAAYLLRKAGRTVRVLEGGDQPGGRIRSFHDPQSGDVLGDRGPSWVWPEHQPVIARWLDELDLDVFEQFEGGK
ncbi:MAG: FAD-dependent oxidoreductase [Hyphomicrobiaceae bacterium]